MLDRRLENIFRPGPTHEDFWHFFFIDSERTRLYNSREYSMTLVTQIFVQQFQKEEHVGQTQNKQYSTVKSYSHAISFEN